MAQKYSRETPKQSSTLPLPNSAIRVTSLMRAGQTFQQATQVQTLRLCPNQGWPRHRPDKLANTRQNPAFTQLSIHPVDPSLGCRATRSNKDVLHCRAECLLLAQSGHATVDRQFPLSGIKRTFRFQSVMSVRCPTDSYSLPKASIGYARAAMRAVAFVSNIRQ